MGPDWVEVGRIEAPRAGPRINGLTVLLLRVGAVVVALDARCPHMGRSLVVARLQVESLLRPVDAPGAAVCLRCTASGAADRRPPVRSSPRADATAGQPGTALKITRQPTLQTSTSGARLRLVKCCALEVAHAGITVNAV